ncbi:MAG: DUF6492 family protein, partial [Beijerinckiaceae bacterium]
IDAVAAGDAHHYVLVADHDVALFRQLAGGRRTVLPDSELLPSWLKPMRRPFDRQGRHVWISTDLRRQVRPLSGWHVQQLRKLALPPLISEEVIVMADSDSVFVKPFGAADFVKDGLVRLYRQPQAIHRSQDGGASDHETWTRLAAKLLGLPEPAFPADDFINNLVSWRNDHARAAAARIAETAGLPVELALGRAGTFSEYQIYGAYASGPAAMEGHFDCAEALSHTYWTGEALDADRLGSFVDKLKPHQIAICVQSFTGTPVELMRGLFRRGVAEAAHT